MNVKRHVRSALWATALLFAAAQAHAFQDDGTVRIGLLEAQTGVPAPYGLQGLEGTRIAFDEINAKGGVMVDGKMVKLAITPAPNGYDPGADTPLTIALMKKLMFDDKVLMIKGTSRSQNTEVAFNYLNELEKQGDPIVLMSSAAAAPGLGKISKWGFRNAFSEDDVIDREVKLLKEKYDVKTAGLYVVRDNSYCSIMEKNVILPDAQEIRHRGQGDDRRPGQRSRSFAPGRSAETSQCRRRVPLGHDAAEHRADEGCRAPRVQAKILGRHRRQHHGRNGQDWRRDGRTPDHGLVLLSRPPRR